MSEKTTPPLNIVNNTEASRFEVELDGHLAICDYKRQGDTLVMPHTVVPPELGGRGIAAALVAAALDWARSEGLRVRPTCSYVAAYMQRHAETQDLLAP
jgi:predicted GNAT family acetyltransferase